MARLIGFIAGCLITTIGVMFFNAPQAPGVAGNEQRLPDEITLDETTLSEQAPQVTDLTGKPMEPVSDKLAAAVYTSSQASSDVEIGRKPLAVEHRQTIFRQPFRSRYSADGFARRLSSETGLQISVIERAPDRYEVGFSYTSEQDLQQKKTLIESKTGLKI